MQLVDTQSFFIHRYKTVGQCITCILVRLKQVIQMIWKKPFFFQNQQTKSFFYKLYA